jgi:hypothetical protein
MRRGAQHGLRGDGPHGLQGRAKGRFRRKEDVQGACGDARVLREAVKGDCGIRRDSQHGMVPHSPPWMGSHFAPLPNTLCEPETKNIISSVAYERVRPRSASTELVVAADTDADYAAAPFVFQVRDIEIKIEQESNRASVLNLEAVRKDFADISMENEALRQRVGA